MKLLRTTIFLLITYTVSYVAVEWSGLFSGQPPSLRGLLTSGFVLILSTAVALLFLVAAVNNRSRMRPWQWIGLIALALVVSGLWISRLYDFRIEIIMTEGQVYRAEGYRSDGLLYAGQYTVIPTLALELRDVETEDNPPDSNADKARVQLLLSTQRTSVPRPITVTGGFPHLENGMFFRVEGLGLSPRYALTKKGRVLETAFVSLRLYPYGSDDYFRLMTPHTLSLQYNPGHKEDNADRPLKLRIARNKDIIHDGYVGLGESVEFEDARLSFEEIRKWAKLSLSRNWGMILALVGAALGVFVVLQRVLLDRGEDR